MAEHEGVPAVALHPVRADRARRWSCALVAEQVADVTLHYPLVARERVRPHAVLRAR